MTHTVTDDNIFQEAWSRYLGEPSPVCSHWVGLDFKPCRGNNRKIDVYGNNVMRSQVYGGDGWCTRHDVFKWDLIEQEASWCQHVEPTNLFVPHITQQEGFMRQIEDSRQRKRFARCCHYYCVVAHVVR